MGELYPFSPTSNSGAEALTTVSKNETVFGERIFKEVI
jgi:hypothetical protein